MYYICILVILVSAIGLVQSSESSCNVFRLYCFIFCLFQSILSIFVCCKLWECGPLYIFHLLNFLHLWISISGVINVNYDNYVKSCAFGIVLFNYRANCTCLWIRSSCSMPVLGTFDNSIRIGQNWYGVCIN